MIDYGKGYSANWRVMAVDPATWAATEEVGGLMSASVERDSTSDLLESGSAEFGAEPPEGEFWGRIEMLAEQSGEVERHAVATLLMSPGDSTMGSGGGKWSYQGRSALAPAIDRVLLAGTYAPQGDDGAAYAASLVQKCTPAPVLVHGSFTLSQHVVFAQGTTHLEAARMLLDSAGWSFRLSGDGSIHIGPKPTEPSLVLDAAKASLLGVEIGLGGGLQDVPNRYIAVNDDETAVAINYDAHDPSSYSARGRYVDVYDDSPQMVDGEGLQAYAERKLAEASESIETRSYTREWWPDVTCGDLVVGSIGTVGLDVRMRVKTQSVEIGTGAVVSESAEVLR